MKLLIQRIIAIIIVCIPGVLAIYGWTVLRDLFFEYTAGLPIKWWDLGRGIFCFAVGIYLLGSFIFYREKKNYNVQDKLLTPEEQEEKRQKKTKKRSFLEKV